MRFATLHADLLPLLASASLAVPVGGSAAAVAPRQAGTRLTVDLTRRFQTIDGFGFSEAFQRANNIINLPEARRNALVELLFSESGAQFSILRNGIGSSPDSRNDWMNTILPRGPSNPDGEPNYVWDGKDSGQLWVSQQAVKYGVKTFYANAWSAPGFMKTNGQDSNGGNLCGSAGSRCNSGDWRQAYANYLIKLIQFYQQEGVTITHLGFLNEPDLSTSYASMQMNGQQAADFVKILHPSLQRANLSQVQIVCCEATGWNAQRTMTSALVQAGAESQLGVISSHLYSSGINGAQPTKLKVWQTEISDLNGRWSTAWYSNGGAADGFYWANQIYTGLTTGNLSAYLWWVGTQDQRTNNNNNEKLILVDTDRRDFVVAKRFWAFAQYSRTVRPGAVRVQVGGGNSLRTTAFLNANGTLAVNVINSGTGAAALTVAGVKAASAKAWITDTSNDMSPVTSIPVGTDGTVGGATVPGRGLLSFLISIAA